MDRSISVIITTYNRIDLLGRALVSVYNQTLLPDEVILIDDGSTDQTQPLIKTRFPKITYIQQANKGVSSARNVGISKAKGQWLAFLDSDDEWLPQKIETQIDQLTKNPHIRICHSNEIWIRHGKRVNPKKIHEKAGGWIFQHCLPLCAISPSSVIIHRSLFEKVGVFDETFPVCEDYDLWLRLTSRFPVLFVEAPLIVKYGGHSDQLSKKYWGMDRFRIKALANILSSGHLKPDDEIAAKTILAKKIKLYLNGARKRNKKTEIEHYETLERKLCEIIA